MKTIKQEESISRSRFIDCPVCKNHTLKLKRVVQVGRCKSCSESYKIIILYVKTGKKEKKISTMDLPPHNVSKPESGPESTLPSWQIPSDASLFGSSNQSQTGFSDTNFSYEHSEEGSESESTSGQSTYSERIGPLGGHGMIHPLGARLSIWNHSS